MREIKDLNVTMSTYIECCQNYVVIKVINEKSCFFLGSFYNILNDIPTYFPKEFDLTIYNLCLLMVYPTLQPEMINL